MQQELLMANLQVLRCSYWAVQAWNHTNLSSPYWRLYWNRQPGADVTWGKTTHALGPDRLLLIAPNTPFRSSLGAGTELEGETNVLVGFPHGEGTDGLATGMVSHFFVHFTLGQPSDSIAPSVIDIEVGTETLGLVSTLTDALCVDRHHLDHRQSFALQSLILFALAHVPEKDWPERQVDPRILRVFGYIDEHLDCRMHNEEFGRIARMSPNAFTRLFKQKTGMTPLAYLNQRRIEQACILLHHTDHSIDEIAEQCGFTDRYYFSRVFHKQLDVGPATYRKLRAS